MRTYWDDFLTEFEERIKDFPLVIILEAFWHYSNNSDRALEIIEDEERKQ